MSTFSTITFTITVCLNGVSIIWTKSSAWNKNKKKVSLQNFTTITAMPWQNCYAPLSIWLDENRFSVQDRIDFVSEEDICARPRFSLAGARKSIHLWRDPSIFQPCRKYCGKKDNWRENVETQCKKRSNLFYQEGTCKKT